MAKPERKPNPQIDPDIRPNLHVIQGGGESASERGNLSLVDNTAQDLDAKERRFGVIQGGGESTPERGNLSAVESNQNIDGAAAREQDAGNAINYTGSGGAGAKKPQNIREALRGRGPLGILIALLFGGIGALGVFFSPGILIIDLKEKYLEKFNDQLAVMDDQSLLLLKKKFKGQGTVIGCTKLSIRCKFNTMSDKQLKKMEKSGLIKVNTTGETTLIKGRNKIESFEFNGKTITAENLIKEVRGDPAFRKALRKGYNPKLAGFADVVFTKLSKRTGINKQQNLTGTTKEELDKQVRKAVSGAAAAEVASRVSSSEEACQSGSEGCVNGKRTIYKDAAGNPISEAEYNKRIDANAGSGFKAEVDQRKSLTDTSGTILKSTLKGALTSTAMGLGAIDSACTGYTLVRTVGFAAKYLGMLQLMRYWQVVANTGDADKAGQGIAEVNAYLGDKLTSTNSQGKSATDSYGYHYAVYGDTAGMPRSEDVKAKDGGSNGLIMDEAQKQQIIVNDETTKYINGQLISDNLMTSLIGFTGKTGSTDQIDSACGFVKSGWGQTIVIGAAVAGAAVAFFTGGASLGWGIAAQTTASVAITVAIAAITPKLIDMAAGTMINGNENGNQAGNAITSGAGAMNTQTFMARGIPVLQKQDAVAYQQKTQQTLAQYAEEDRLEHGPLDPTNRNTFVGSIVSNLMPYATKMSSLTSALPAVVSLTADSVGRLTPQANAATSAEFDVCQDRDYLNENAAADPFCNLRGGFVDEVANIDSDAMLDYMIGSGYMNEETGEPKTSDNEYAKYLTDCTERTVPIGGYTDSNPDRGTKCIQGRNGNEEPKLNMFRKASVLVGVNEGMDNGEVAPPPTAGGGGGAAPGVVTGDARSLALQVIANENITYVDPATKEQLKIFGEGGQVFDPNLRPMTVSKYLLGALLTNAKKYKILINNIGFHEDRSLKENIPYQHPAGTAVDLNNIEIIGGASTGGSIELPADAVIANQYATDFLAALPLNRGGVGQSDHGMNPTFPPGSIALNGSHLFPDAGNHLHIDARNRENLHDTQ